MHFQSKKNRLMNKGLIVIMWVLLISLTGCKKDTETVYVLPKDYLPAYPQSFWDYSNGQRVLVASTYQSHSYQDKINSPAYTATKYVPVIDGRYLYEYSIYQNSTAYPLKELLSESSGASWVINELNNEKVYRAVISQSDAIDITLLQSSGTKDTTFSDVITVVEYLESLGQDAWSLREYYAKGVGLIRVDVSNPYEGEAFVIQKELVNYSINK